MIINGQIESIGEIEEIKGGEFYKLNYVLGSEKDKFNVEFFQKAEYKKFVEDFKQNKRVGDFVNVELSFNVREHNGRSYQQIKHWKLIS